MTKDPYKYKGTPKQTLAQKRNWTKARLLGFKISINTETLSKTEQETLKTVQILIDNVIENWDNNTKKIGLGVSPYRKCKSCWMKRKLNTHGYCNNCVNKQLSENE